MTASAMTAWGIIRAPDVLILAAEAGLSPSVAAALLEQESGGGRNVWGHDAVPTNGAYIKGAEVTEAAYRQYRRSLAGGSAGQQGVGPCQLTSRGYQDQADALGGCWDWTCNVRVGFGLLAGYIDRWGLTDAFRAYNGGAGNRRAGSNINADHYAAQAMQRYARWVDRLGAGPPTTAPAVHHPAPAPAAAPNLSKGDDLMMNVPINPHPDGSFRAAAVCEAGRGSALVERAWVVFGLTWGGTADVTVSFLGDDGLVLPPGKVPGQVRRQVANNRRLVADVPDGAVLVTFEGHTSNGSTPTAAVLTEARA